MSSENLVVGPSSNGEGFDNLLVVGGLLDGFLKRLIGGVQIDFSKVNRDKLKHGIRDFTDAFKPAVTAPFDLDDKALDALADFLIELVDRINKTPLIVGEPMVGTSRKDIEEMIRKLGGDPSKLSPTLLLLLSLLVGPLLKMLLEKLLKQGVI